eukprot:scaffold4116_cov106-Isochrysis_galbana.AAC.2
MGTEATGAGMAGAGVHWPPFGPGRDAAPCSLGWPAGPGWAALPLCPASPAAASVADRTCTVCLMWSAAPSPEASRRSCRNLARRLRSINVAEVTITSMKMSLAARFRSRPVGQR